MAFWSEWPDGKKWFMGILSGLIVATIVGLVKMNVQQEESQPGQTTPSVETPASPVPTKTPTETTTVTKETPAEKPRESLAVNPPQDPPLTTKAGPYPKQDTHSGATIDLPQCSTDGARLHCTSLVTLDESGWMSVLWSSSIFSANGIEVKLTRARLGSTEGKPFVHVKLIARTPTRLELDFDGIPENLAGIAALRISSDRGSFEFHNIDVGS
jgi:hypothetical protein